MFAAAPPDEEEERAQLPRDASHARNPALSSVSAPNRAMEQSATWRSTFAGACAMIRA
jgi:hypothetical protein